MSKIKRNIGYGHVCIRQKPRELCFDVIATRLSILYFKALMSDAPSRALEVGDRLPTPGQGCTSSRANYRIHTRQQVPAWSPGNHMAGNTNHPDLSGRPI